MVVVINAGHTRLCPEDGKETNDVILVAPNLFFLYVSVFSTFSTLSTSTFIVRKRSVKETRGHRSRWGGSRSPGTSRTRLAAAALQGAVRRYPALSVPGSSWLRTGRGSRRWAWYRETVDAHWCLGAVLPSALGSVAVVSCSQRPGALTQPLPPGEVRLRRTLGVLVPSGCLVSSCTLW